MLEPEEQSQPAVIGGTFKKLWELGRKKGGRDLTGAKVEGKKSSPVWEEKIKRGRGRESWCKEKVTAPPAS